MLGGRREKLSENKIRAIRMLHEKFTYYYSIAETIPNIPHPMPVL